MVVPIKIGEENKMSETPKRKHTDKLRPHQLFSKDYELFIALGGLSQSSKLTTDHLSKGSLPWDLPSDLRRRLYREIAKR